MATERWHDLEPEDRVPAGEPHRSDAAADEADVGATGAEVSGETERAEEGEGRGPYGFLHGGSGFQEGHGNEGYGSENYGGQNYVAQNEYGRQTYGVEGGPETGEPEADARTARDEGDGRGEDDGRGERGDAD